MDDETWVKAVKVLYPGIRKTKVSNVALCFYYFILYLFNSPYLSLQILCRRFMISQSGGHYSNIIVSSIKWMLLIP